MSLDETALRQLKEDLGTVFSAVTRLSPRDRVEKAKELLEEAEETEDELQKEAEALRSLISSTEEKLDGFLERNPCLMNGEVA